ncbi:diheme cytochrome c [Ancylothrix sp. C2]|uniref:diheme cytochrome c n=1 Tax=Ancylothrix sp. D3o TaxID=2953691 RepID=UPI0021BB4299|nr:diheme cytochrome c [Ancylothrix sp. D3o]MCT7948574.1 diheme cytochrome c [Ancylothrix sp. D3o]
MPNSRTLRATIIILIAAALSIGLGWGLASSANPPRQNTTDLLSNPQLQYGQELYLENCATCHLGLPPAVMPTETWQQLLSDTQHYGVQVKIPPDPFRVLIWNYLLISSRLLQKEEETPYRLAESRHFKALHPRVKFNEPVKLNTCISCHPSASDYNFRDLSPEWQNSP